MLLGYACINITRGSKTRTLRLKTAKSQGTQYIYDLITANLRDILANLHWNVDHNIFVYRISSEIFPHITNPQLNGNIPAYELSSVHRKLIAEIGLYALKNKIHISFHCTPYTHLGSKSQRVVDNSILDMKWIYGTFIKLAKYPMIIIVHPDGCGDDITDASKRFARNFKRLPKLLRDNLCLENTECVNTHHTLQLCNKIKIPLVFDYFHAQVNPRDTPPKSLKHIKATWIHRHGRLSDMGPLYSFLKVYKFHISNQAPNAMIGAHSEYVKSIPGLLNSKKHIIMVEAKAKEKAVLKLI